MKLTVKDGKVGFIMRAGKDFSRNEMRANAANAIIEKGEVTESTLFKDYPLNMLRLSYESGNWFGRAKYPFNAAQEGGHDE